MRTSKQAGFTLVELMTVVAIIGITAGLGIVYLDSDEKGKAVQGYAEKLGAQFEMARARAISTQKRQRITVNVESFQHWQYVDTGLAQLTDPNLVTSWEFIGMESAPSGVVVDAVDNTLHFDENDGLPTSGDGMVFQIDLLPDGRARSVSAANFFDYGWTVFMVDELGKSPMRTLLFAVTGTSTTYDNW